MSRARCAGRASRAVACAIALALVSCARASVLFDPPSGTRATKSLRVTMRTTDDAATTTIVYTLNGATPAVDGEDTKVYEGGVTLPCVREAMRSNFGRDGRRARAIRFGVRDDARRRRATAMMARRAVWNDSTE